MSAIILPCIVTLIIAFLYKGGVSRYGNKQYQTVEERADRALKYASRNGLNQNYCLLLDYSIPSGTPRLMLWSFAENKVVYKAHAMHGPGNGSTAEHPVFSNKPGSNCSSLGKFEVTKEHGNVNKTGFYLRGREFSNSSARLRGIMLHGSRWVDVNQWRKYIPLNTKSCLGCVTVSSKEMKYLYNLIEKENDHLLLWSYCSESS
ncbi:MAG: murein L,D-transpeptidase catalytic domain family protein [Bacteroidales bacterium]|nr:murein L,D-transpeptidase catalytic domain family protein [Bacteroidales bacterium]